MLFQLSLHSYYRYVYWTVEGGSEARIERGAMDGNASSRTVIVDTNIRHPYGLTIDHTYTTLYWTDRWLDQIHSCNVNGSNRVSVLQGLSEPRGITVTTHALYWIDWYDGTVYVCNNYTGGTCTNNKVLLTGLYYPWGIKVLPKGRQNPGMYIICQYSFKCRQIGNQLYYHASEHTCNS